jgi:hypothetical protein
MAYSEPFSGHFKRGLGTFSVGGFVAKETENPSHCAARREKKKQREIKPNKQKIFFFSIADLLGSSPMTFLIER